MNLSTEILLFIVFLLLSAFFSGSESAVLAFSKLRLQNLVQKKNKRALILNNLMKKPEKLISTILIGNNIANVAAASLATIIVTNILSDFGASQATVVIVATGFTTVFLLVVGEITPKSIAIQKPVPFALNAVIILKALHVIFAPIVYSLSFLPKLIEKALKGQSKQGITIDDVRALSSLLKEDNVFEPVHLKMISNIFEFSTRQINQVMVPRSDIEFIRYDATYQDVEDTINKFNYKRYPVYKEHRDEVLGIFNAFKILFYKPEQADKNFDVTDYLITPLFVSEFSSLLGVLRKMQKTQIPFALVVDEYGSITGSVTLEVILEEIVGEIIDETEEPTSKVYSISIPDGNYIVEGNISLNDLKNECCVSIDIGDLEIDTLGGLIWHKIGKKPKIGSEIIIDNYKFRVDTMIRNRIKKVSIQKIQK